MTFELRAATEADREWLFALDRTTTGEAGEPAAARASFDRHFAPGAIQVIVAGGADCGALRVEQRGDTLYLAVLEVAPEAQGRGLGTAVLRALLARADAEGRPVALRVHKGNAGARGLYERLGFRVTGESGAKWEMRREGGGLRAV